MHWGNKYYYGTVLDTETLNMADDGGEGDLPLCNVEENTARKVEENSTRENSKKRETDTSDSNEEENLPLSYLSKTWGKKSQVNDSTQKSSDSGSNKTSHIENEQNPEGRVVRKCCKVKDLVGSSEIHVEISGEKSDFELSDSDDDPLYVPDNVVKACEVSDCKKEVFSCCHICSNLLCYDHFIDMGPCENDHKTQPSKPLKRKGNKFQGPARTTRKQAIEVPEDFPVEGPEREEGTLPSRKTEGNKRKRAHEKRLKREEYVSPKTGKTVFKRNVLKPRCNGVTCSKLGKECSKLSEEERKEILHAYYETSDIQLQREYIVRMVKVEDVKVKTVKDHSSRRSKSLYYYLPQNRDIISVCKTMFLNTLNISDKTVRTALDKKQLTGTIEKDRRGGRPKSLAEEDKIKRDAILQHINRFPRMESHYCRKDSKRDYLHPDLNKQMMYEMFLKECESENISTSYTTYCTVLKSQNISLHNRKKDLCKICENYRKGDATKKEELEELFQKHQQEKEAVRKIKDKEKSDSDQGKTVAVFDLQPVIYLPQTNDNQLYYKRRLANFNLTIYELKSRQCHCFTWHEGQGKRGACEIATCLRLYLEEFNTKGVKEVTLFADGCPGQNKNSIIAAMLLHTVHQLENIDQISILYFEAYHGQNEGDSAHSAIKTAIDNAGDLYVPAQLIPVFHLARRKNPYTVHTLQSRDFLDYKKMSKDLRILSIRRDDQGNSVDWTKMQQIMVKKTDTDKIFFKTSHLEETFKSLTLKIRCQAQQEPHQTYSEPPMIAKDKYDDLMSLCEGALPVIRVTEYVNFFQSLPHFH